jgi:hypothetical protein
LPLALASGTGLEKRKALAKKEKKINHPYRFSAIWAEAKRNFYFFSFLAKALLFHYLTTS